MPLTTRERAVLDLERGWWMRAPTKERAIRTELGCSPAAYYAVLRRLATSPEAFAYDPLVVKRLRRRLDQRRLARYGPRPAAQHRPH